MTEIRIGNPNFLSLHYEYPELKPGQEFIKGDISSDIQEFSKEKTKELISDQLSEFKDGTLCLSGGYDSQFLALSMIESDFKFSVVIYESLWGNNVVNANDVMFSEKFCKKYNLPYEIISIDAKDFFENTKMLPMVKKYRNWSPQILFHIYFLNTLEAEKIIIGGDPPWITFGNNKAHNVNLFGYVEKYYVPYQIYADLKNKKLLKGIFHQSPDLYHLGMANNIDILKKYNVYQPTNDNFIYEKYRYKEIYYNNILDIPLEHRLMTATGFENLKKHYASITGIYDNFDKEFRAPLEEIAVRSLITSENKPPAIQRIKFNKDINELYFMKKFEETIKTSEAQPLKDFLFDF